MASRGHTAVGLDLSPTLVRHARTADAGSAYLVGDATALPFVDATFDTVIAFNSLQTMAAVVDMTKAVREAARVLRPAGRLCFCVAHPMTDVARLHESTTGDIVISGSYFENERVDDTVTKGGGTMTFRGWTHTVEDYARALEDAGLLIERLREPLPGREGIGGTSVRAVAARAAVPVHAGGEGESLSALTRPPGCSSWCIVSTP